jgi:hypothetical protein
MLYVPELQSVTDNQKQMIDILTELLPIIKQGSFEIV